jgi:hypothetical protein
LQERLPPSRLYGGPSCVDNVRKVDRHPALIMSEKLNEAGAQMNRQHMAAVANGYKASLQFSASEA